MPPKQQQKDFYAVLGVSNNASIDEIKRAYKKAALKNHPDRIPANATPAQRAEAEQRFKEAANAFSVLSDPEKKRTYDNYGHAGLSGADGGTGGGHSAGGGSFPGGSGFSQEDAARVFKSFFGDLGSEGGGGFSRFFQQGSTSGMGGMPGGFQAFSFPMGGMGGTGGAAAGDSHTHGASSKYSKDMSPPPIEYPFACTLEEIASGCTKKFNVTRRLADGREDKKLFVVRVEPGYKKNTKITFEREGGCVEGFPTAETHYADLVFILEERPHPKFTRLKNDLKIKHTITLKEALLGTVLTVQTLDGSRNVSVPVAGVTASGRTLRVAGEGMYDRKSKTTGNLIVELAVSMPQSLTSEQRRLIEQCNF